MEKPGRIKGKDPRAKKARDNARKTTRGHKSAERAARKVKVHGTQSVRRAGKVAVRDADGIEESAATLPRAARRAKPKVWPSSNAHSLRKRRAAERAYLDATAKTKPKGRRRAVENRKDWDRS